MRGPKTRSIVLVAALLAAVIAGGCSMPSPGTSGTPVTGTGQVSIANFAFSPSAISVKVGTTVTWTNNDSMTHTVTSTSGPTSFDSGPRTAGQTFSYTFASTGTWNYWCSFHPSMTGTVTVTN